ncbi:MAG: NAD(P)-dependent oxidoreductase [Oscillochloris sp.]|nr:NAD(P)-dependent oxidoreductase [Oscillochloris sp.]
MTVLITGIGGYIGRRLAATLLARGDTVRGIDRRREGLADLATQGVKAIVADVTDQAIVRAALDGVTTVYHLAGSPFGRRNELEQSALRAAEALSAACIAQPQLQALIFASSGALYPSGPQQLDEATPPQPAFAYARSKHAAEQYFLNAHAERGLPVRIARIGAVYGPAAPALMIEQVRRGRFPLIGGGHGYTSSIQIDDAIQALIAVAERGRAGRIYNLVDDEPATVREFYTFLAQQLGAPPPPSIPVFAARMLVFAANTGARLRGRPAPLPADLTTMAQVSHRIANRRMHDELGLKLRFPNYRAGLTALTENES